jgi:tetratricopeptide (TPR) repeat protein
MESGNFQIIPRTPANTRLLNFLKLHRSVLSGQTDNALAEADQLIAASDHDKEAWIAKGDIFMLKDQPDEALQAFDRALSLHKKTDREPIAIMTRRRAAFMRSLEKRGVLPAQKQP